jgi:hypothetical protein
LERPVRFEQPQLWKTKGSSTTLSATGPERKPGERAVAIGAIATMVEFSRLADSPEGRSAVDREARLIDSGNLEVVRAKLVGLVHRHRTEWEGFVNSLPNRSWVREVVGRL